MSDRIAPGSTLIRNTLNARLDAVEAGVTTHELLQLSASEFDDVRLGIQSADGPNLVVSIGGPTGVLPAGAQEVAAGAYSQYAKVLSPPQGDFDLSLEIDLSSIPKERAARVAVVEHLACLRCVVYGTTLRNYFAALAAGTSSDGPLVAIAHGHEREFYLKPQREQIAVVFPMRFEDASDAVVAQTFLAMFNEAKRQPALSTAPTCSYAKPGSPPMELSEGGVVSGKMLAANGGFVSFVLFRRHVEGDKLETAVWNMLSFPAFISFHIKCSKAYWHGRMRKRAGGWLQVLNRAKQPPFGGVEKKTASGRTFSRKDREAGVNIAGLNI